MEVGDTLRVSVGVGEAASRCVALQGGAVVGGALIVEKWVGP